MTAESSADRPWTTERRRALVESLPYVRRLARPVPCDGVKHGEVSLRDLYPWGPKRANPPRGIPDKARCRMRAWWRFTALKNSWARDGNYCTAHLYWAGIYGDMAEEARTQRWVRRRVDEGL